MSAPSWMPFYVADYLADTGHLSTIEHGAYLLLIMHYWQNGGLPTEDPKLARICRLSSKEWQNIKGTLADLFDEGWRHKRIDVELAKAEETISKRSAAGKAGASARYSNRTADAMANAEQTNAPLPSPTPFKSTEKVSEEPRAKPNGKHYAVELRTIRLTDEDFQRWEKSFPHLSLRAELEGLDAWASDQDNWFNAVAGALAKREREIVKTLASERQARGSPQQGELLPPKDDTEAEKRLKLGRQQKRWPRDRWGPAPHEDGCLIPSHLIEPTDRDWADWNEARH